MKRHVYMSRFSILWNGLRFLSLVMVTLPASIHYKKCLPQAVQVVMIGRAGVGQPWLIKKLVSEMNQVHFISPDLKKIGNYFFEHVSLLSQLLGNDKFAVLQARKLQNTIHKNY